MIDIALNLDNARFDADREAVVLRAQEAGVSALILTGTDIASSEAVAELCEQWPGYAFCTAGVHPHDARHWDERSAHTLRRLAALPRLPRASEAAGAVNAELRRMDGSPRR